MHFHVFMLHKKNYCYTLYNINYVCLENLNYKYFRIFITCLVIRYSIIFCLDHFSNMKLYKYIIIAYDLLTIYTRVDV